MGDGATVIGVKAVDGVILASERRLSYNGFILSKSARKVYAITKHIGAAFAGLYADTQTLVKMLKAEAQYYKLELGRDIPVRALAKVLSNILYSYKLLPFYAESIVGGIDDKGPHIYILDPLGSLIEDDYAVAGTGGPIAIGVIEAEYVKDINVKKTKEIVIKAMKAALKRDAVSGDGIDVLIITKEGCKLEQIPFKR